MASNAVIALFVYTLPFLPFLRRALALSHVYRVHYISNRWYVASSCFVKSETTTQLTGSPLRYRLAMITTLFSWNRISINSLHCALDIFPNEPGMEAFRSRKGGPALLPIPCQRTRGLGEPGLLHACLTSQSFAPSPPMASPWAKAYATSPATKISM